MLKKIIKNNINETTLYNNILLLSRNKSFYTKFNLTDTFQNRINLIFIHISFIFMKIDQNNENKKYKVFYQKIFDLIFKKIELNMREIGYGDVTVNKNMKYLVKTFYNILLNCKMFKKKSLDEKNIFFSKYFEFKNIQKTPNYQPIIKYFDKYESFCFDLNADSVLEGDLFFNYE